jgi:acetoin utilization deacetylase AcuC-like enzyme
LPTTALRFFIRKQISFASWYFLHEILGVKIITDAHCVEYAKPEQPERPARIADSVQLLRRQTELPIDWIEPTTVEDRVILRAHGPEVLARMKIPVDIDEDTPFYENITRYARASVAASLDALTLARQGETVFSLMRPPGHHATREKSMGFCFLNNVAIATLEALATGAKRVAVFDFDVHHGNGTENILLGVPGVQFYSVHHYPGYPYTGGSNRAPNCFNYIVDPHAVRGTYLATLERALTDLRRYEPDLIAVSAGFDPYVRDPVGNGQLLLEDFHHVGRTLKDLKTPMFHLLEGGYSRHLPELIFAYLKGLAGLEHVHLPAESKKQPTAPPPD